MMILHVGLYPLSRQNSCVTFDVLKQELERNIKQFRMETRKTKQIKKTEHYISGQKDHKEVDSEEIRSNEFTENNFTSEYMELGAK